ncbi:MAG: tyrosine-type recombinase/integrase [Deltaproteobacteria bacterium]|nr:tyrosine-type recombinase/integrase [Rhodospirillaceae bacterium]MDE0343130.1 tyrosine-type recombinase/integrase [Deltaproteobacteria bacterium]
MAKCRLTQRRVDTLTPRKTTLDVRDSLIRGFGVRILPSGRKSYFLHHQVDGKRVWHSIGDARTMTLECAREQAASLLASRSHEEDESPDGGRTILFEDVADEVFRRYQRHWKPRTLKVNRGYLKNQILPWFRGRAIGAITRHDVQRWFASLHATPVAADRSAPVLSVILRQAEVYGYRPEGSNPCTGIKRYRRRNRERFLTNDEIRRLSRVLDEKLAQQPLLAALVRLLLLTGCRKSEILTLQWSDYREGRLYLSDSKTGPRTVWLSSFARGIIDGLPRRGRWMFPSFRGGGHLSEGTLTYFWYDVRSEAAITDVRCHDLRHAYASVALAHGETIVTIGRLLGHNDPATTLKYAHLADAAVHEAAEALVSALDVEN